MRVKDTWSGYKDGKTRAWLLDESLAPDITVDFTSSIWSEMVNQQNGGCDLTWSTCAPASTDNANGTQNRTFYAVIKQWDTAKEPFTEYYKQATHTWFHFEEPTVGHNGDHEISIMAVDGDTAKTALEFQHYDATAQPAGWQAPVATAATTRKLTVENLLITNISPG